MPIPFDQFELARIATAIAEAVEHAIRTPDTHGGLGVCGEFAVEVHWGQQHETVDGDCGADALYILYKAERPADVLDNFHGVKTTFNRGWKEVRRWDRKWLLTREIHTGEVAQFLNEGEPDPTVVLTDNHGVSVVCDSVEEAIEAVQKVAKESQGWDFVTDREREGLVEDVQKAYGEVVYHDNPVHARISLPYSKGEFNVKRPAVLRT